MTALCLPEPLVRTEEEKMESAVTVLGLIADRVALCAQATYRRRRASLCSTVSTALGNRFC